MELRDIEIFLALAEELHFGRTAGRLHVSPARVSQSIKKTERRVGVPLFVRTSRTVRLTPAGRRLHEELGAGYRQIMHAIAEASATAGKASGTLTLGTMGPQAWMINEAVESFQRRHPTVRLDHRDINPVTPLDALRSEQVDIALLWLPVREPDVTVGPITHTSPVVLLLAASHPYADRDSVCLEDYGDLTFVAHESSIPPHMEEVFQPFRTPSGRSIQRGPLITNWDDQVKAVSAGQAVIATVAEAARFYPWPDLVYLPVRDAPPVRWALTWRTAAETPLIRAFAQIAAGFTDTAC